MQDVQALEIPHTSGDKREIFPLDSSRSAYSFDCTRSTSRCSMSLPASTRFCIASSSFIILLSALFTTKDNSSLACFACVNASSLSSECCLTTLFSLCRDSTWTVDACACESFIFCICCSCSNIACTKQASFLFPYRGKNGPFS